MLNIVLRKFIFACFSLLFVLILTFVLMKFIPGDPFMQEQALPTEIYIALKDHYGLNEPVTTQFMRYFSNFFQLNFGPSLVYKGRSVTEIIMSGLPASALLGAEALLFAVPCGILFGIIASLKHNRWQDKLILVCAVLGISLPSFIIATILQYVLAIKLHLLPIARWGSFTQSIMPALALAALPMGFIARMTRSKMIVEMRQPYVATARAKGLSEAKIIFSHVLRNILPPILSYLGPLTASVMTGSFVIEKIFAIPGVGYWFVNSVLTRDYPLILAITIFYCELLLLANFLVDIFCLWLDPRLSHASKNKGKIA